MKISKLQPEDLEQAMDSLSRYFGISFRHQPKIKIDNHILGGDECRFKREMPFFQRRIIISPNQAEGELGGERRVLEHELVHWLEYDARLNGYPKRPSPHRAFPNHFLHIIYSGELDRQWLLGCWGSKPDILLVRTEPELSQRLLTALGRNAPWLKNHLERFEATTGEPTAENLERVSALLHDARSYYQKNPDHRRAEHITPHFFIAQHYETLLSVYSADCINRKADSALSFLRELNSVGESLTERIDLSFFTRSLLTFVDFE